MEGSTHTEDVAVVWVVVLLLRFLRFWCPRTLADLKPLFTVTPVNPWTLDAWISSLCVRCGDSMETFVLQTVLITDRFWCDWSAVGASRPHIFELWWNTWTALPLQTKHDLGPVLWVLSNRLLRLTRAMRPATVPRSRSPRSRSRSPRSSIHRDEVRIMFFCNGRLYNYVTCFFATEDGRSCN